MRNRRELNVVSADPKENLASGQVGRTSVFYRKIRSYYMFIKQLLIVCYSCCLLACATSDEALEDPYSESVSRRSNCISEASIRDYQVLDESNLIVAAAGKRKYHVLLSRPAFGLRSTWRLGFAGSTSQICAGFGEIYYDQGFGIERIRIQTIVPLDQYEEDRLLVRFGLKEPEFEQPRTPEKVDGAEVEELD